MTPAATTVERIEQRIVHLDRGAKQDTLAEILRKEPVDRALVFTRTKHGADKVVRGLNKSGIAAEAIHGNKSQGQRERVLAAFRAGKVRTLVATDIAARGIDVDGISHVINFDLPNIPESYVHRIGRTARAGADGIAISLCSSDEVAFLRDIEKLIRMSIPATGEVIPHRGAPRPAQHQGHNGAPHRGGRNGRGHHNGAGARTARTTARRPASATASVETMPKVMVKMATGAATSGRRCNRTAKSQPLGSCSASRTTGGRWHPTNPIHQPR